MRAYPQILQAVVAGGAPRHRAPLYRVACLGSPQKLLEQAHHRRTLVTRSLIHGCILVRQAADHSPHELLFECSSDFAVRENIRSGGGKVSGRCVKPQQSRDEMTLARPAAARSSGVRDMNPNRACAGIR